MSLCWQVFSVQGRVGSLWADATFEMDSTHVQTSFKNYVGAPYTGHPRQMSLSECIPF